MNLRVQVPRGIAVGAAACALALVVAGCSSSANSGSSSNSTAASAGGGSTAAGAPSSVDSSVLSDALKPGTWNGPTTSPAAVKGKKLFVLESIGAGTSISGYRDGVVAAAKAIGWSTTVYDGQATVSRYASGLEQAVNQKYDGIVLLAVTPTLVAPQVAAARSAGIPIVDISNSTAPSATGVVANIGYRPEDEANILAQQVIKDSGGKAHIGVIIDNEFGVIAARTNAFMKDIGDDCPGCKISTKINITASQLGTSSLVSQIQSTLLRNTDINYMFAAYDDAANEEVQAVLQAGLQDKVKVVSAEGNAQNLDYVKTGKVQNADLAVADAWMGWEAIDAMNRIFQGKQSTLDASVLNSEPDRLFTTTDNKPNFSGAWTGDYDYQTAYKKLWGV
jgi:ribose transport system substrate-binding protein